ncbi:unnamed protein product [Cyprideis torosa]|uniref:Uncharacterized protein n=1 Tax=Cyprideis torosa TaxID=163714 RepID=A0A7R8ZJH5_9CRUS|nr:unnamed protein product [Cyprideis torosa]CAG0886984.1 unnamed protein product [Cyprideis torosa]
MNAILKDRSEGSYSEVERLAQQISDHAEVLYQTWRSHGINPGRVLDKMRLPTAASSSPTPSQDSPSSPAPSSPITDWSRGQQATPSPFSVGQTNSSPIPDWAKAQTTPLAVNRRAPPASLPVGSPNSANSPNTKPPQRNSIFLNSAVDLLGSPGLEKQLEDLVAEFINEDKAARSFFPLSTQASTLPASTTSATREPESRLRRRGASPVASAVFKFERELQDRIHNKPTLPAAPSTNSGRTPSSPSSGRTPVVREIPILLEKDDDGGQPTPPPGTWPLKRHHFQPKDTPSPPTAPAKQPTKDTTKNYLDQVEEDLLRVLRAAAEAESSVSSAPTHTTPATSKQNRKALRDEFSAYMKAADMLSAELSSGAGRSQPSSSTWPHPHPLAQRRPEEALSTVDYAKLRFAHAQKQPQANHQTEGRSRSPGLVRHHKNRFESGLEPAWVFLDEPFLLPASSPVGSAGQSTSQALPSPDSTLPGSTTQTAPHLQEWLRRKANRKSLHQRPLAFASPGSAGEDGSSGVPNGEAAGVGLQPQLPHPELTEAQKQHIRERSISPTGYTSAGVAIRPFLTRGSVAERVYIFEKCPPEIKDRTGLHHKGTGVSPGSSGTNLGAWRSNEVHNRAQTYAAPAEEVKKSQQQVLGANGDHRPPHLQSKLALSTLRRQARRKPAEIPRFHFPRGKPLMGDQIEATIHRIEAAFSAFPRGQVTLDKFGVIAKACDLPLFTKAPLFNAALDASPSASSSISKGQFVEFWRSLLTRHSTIHAQFLAILSKNRRDYLIPEDFVTLLQDVVESHPGLSFLKDAVEFHSRYVHTVMARIFYKVNRSWTGRITLPELARSNLLEAIFQLEKEDDINQVREYFSYEHFYVIYCKFWELDTDHDLFIDKTDLSRHNDGAISSRMIERIFSGAVTRGKKEDRMSYTGFIWFLLSDEDKRTPTAIEYWFRCMDLDGDGYLSMYELHWFYQEQMERLEALGIEATSFQDTLCQMLDMVRPAERDKISLSDLKRSPLTPVFFDTFFNLEKYLEHEQRDPFTTLPYDENLSDWDRFCAEEYEILVAEEGDEEPTVQIVTLLTYSRDVDALPSDLMTSYEDFRSSWSARFPESEIPPEWVEDDTRATLQKRQAELERLRNEAANLQLRIEQEQFYVHYLEKFLSDAEAQRRASASGSSSSCASDDNACASEAVLSTPPREGVKGVNYITVIKVKEAPPPSPRLSTEDGFSGPSSLSSQPQPPVHLEGGAMTHPPKKVPPRPPPKRTSSTTKAMEVTDKPNPPTRPSIDTQNWRRSAPPGSYAPLPATPPAPSVGDQQLTSTPTRPVPLCRRSLPPQTLPVPKGSVEEEDDEDDDPVYDTVDPVTTQDGERGSTGSPVGTLQSNTSSLDGNRYVCWDTDASSSSPPGSRERKKQSRNTPEHRMTPDAATRCALTPDSEEDPLRAQPHELLRASSSEGNVDEDDDSGEDDSDDQRLAPPDDHPDGLDTIESKSLHLSGFVVASDNNPQQRINSLSFFASRAAVYSTPIDDASHPPPLLSSFSHHRSSPLRQQSYPSTSSSASGNRSKRVTPPQVPKRVGSESSSSSGHSGHTHLNPLRKQNSEGYVPSPSRRPRQIETEPPPPSPVTHGGLRPAVPSRGSVTSGGRMEPTSPSKTTDDTSGWHTRSSHILDGILKTERQYLDCLESLKKHMEALESNLTTSKGVIKRQDLSVIFKRVPELHAHHNVLYEQLLNGSHGEVLGEPFLQLATKLEDYGIFIANYQSALATIQRASQHNEQFAEISKSIALVGNPGKSLPLSDVLHKPISRIQAISEQLNPSRLESVGDRHVVRNDFIVEEVDGNRKLRHLFLFNDLIACAKCKEIPQSKPHSTGGNTSSGPSFTFEVKWWIPLSELLIPSDEPGKPIYTASSQSASQQLESLKSEASSIRGKIMRHESKEDLLSSSPNGSVGHPPKKRSLGLDRHRRKLETLESRLVLVSPNLLLRLCHLHRRSYTFLLSSDHDRAEWVTAIKQVKNIPRSPVGTAVTQEEIQQRLLSIGPQHLVRGPGGIGAHVFRKNSALQTPAPLVGDLIVKVLGTEGLNRTKDRDPQVFLELDSHGHFFQKARASLAPFLESERQEFRMELEGSTLLRVLLYALPVGLGTNRSDYHEYLIGKGYCDLLCLKGSRALETKVDVSPNVVLHLSLQYLSCEMTIRRPPKGKASALFGRSLDKVCGKEDRWLPFIIAACVHEVERRGMQELGIYRVSGSASDVAKLRKAFETSHDSAQSMIREVDIHAVTGILKLYLRELPEALFTDELYPSFFQSFHRRNGYEKEADLSAAWDLLPERNKKIIDFLLEHLILVNRDEKMNKMSLHNLATVLGPTVLRPGAKTGGGPSSGGKGNKNRETVQSANVEFITGTFDVMAQAGVFYFFLQRTEHRLRHDGK